MRVIHNPSAHEQDMQSAIDTLQRLGIREIRGYKWLSVDNLQGTTMSRGPRHQVGVVKDLRPASIKACPTTNHGLHFFVGEPSPDLRLTTSSCLAEVSAKVSDLVAINGGEAACKEYRVLKIHKLTAAKYVSVSIADIKNCRYFKPSMELFRPALKTLKATPLQIARLQKAITAHNKLVAALGR